MIYFDCVKDYADSSGAGQEATGLVLVQIAIAIDGPDWYRFQDQEFFQPLSEYLKQNGTPGNYFDPVHKEDTQEALRYKGTAPRVASGPFFGSVHKGIARLRNKWRRRGLR